MKNIFVMSNCKHNPYNRNTHEDDYYGYREIALNVMEITKENFLKILDEIGEWTFKEFFQEYLPDDGERVYDLARERGYIIKEYDEY